MSNFNRREILASFLGLPLAIAACRNSRIPALPAGTIVGTSDVFGHQLRDGVQIQIPPDKWIDVPVVIVGGGIAGLSAARHLTRSAFEDFVLIELENVAGGTSRSGEASGISSPLGAPSMSGRLDENSV